MAGDQRHIVWVQRIPGWRLDPVTETECVAGGHRWMHELAVAIAATGRRVEMRGHVDHRELAHLGDAAGAAPELPAEPFRPGAGDVVLMTEGSADPADFAYVALSGARAILVVLGPPGLLGWPFVAGWSERPPPLTVSIDAVARPEHFRAMAAMGFELWTSGRPLAEHIRASAVHCHCVGTGRPVPYPEPLPKRWDVVTLANNRWAELAGEVLTRLDPAISRHQIPAGSNDEVLRQLGQGRLLIHPLRIEGDSRIGLEARAMGTVPVVLKNPFSLGLDEHGGAVPVSSLDEMPAAVVDLLGDPDRLAAYRARALRSAHEQVDWTAYVSRIDAALASAPPDDPAREARAIIGERLMEKEDETLIRLRAGDDELARARAQLSHVHDELGYVRAALATEQARANSIRATRAWRLAIRYWALRARARWLLQLFRDPRSFPREVPPAEREHPRD